MFSDRQIVFERDCWFSEDFLVYRGPDAFDKIKTAEIKTEADGHTTLLCGPASVKTESDKWRTDATLGLRLDNDTLDCNGLTWYAIPNAKEAEDLLKKYLPL